MNAEDTSQFRKTIIECPYCRERLVYHPTQDLYICEPCKVNFTEERAIEKIRCMQNNILWWEESKTTVETLIDCSCGKKLIFNPTEEMYYCPPDGPCLRANHDLEATYYSNCIRAGEEWWKDEEPDDECPRCRGE